jgi:hypothetical protein
MDFARQKEITKRMMSLDDYAIWTEEMRAMRLEFLGSHASEQVLIELVFMAAKRWGFGLGCEDEFHSMWLILDHLGMKIVPIN